jgi:hypothetical protein
MDRRSELVGKLERFFTSEEAPGVVSAYLFGSEANGTAHRESDVDVAVLLDWALFPSTKQRFDQRVDLGSALIAALHRNEIDVVILNDAPPMLAKRILREGHRVACADPEADRIFRRDTILRAADLEPWLRRFDAKKLEALRR